MTKEEVEAPEKVSRKPLNLIGGGISLFYLLAIAIYVGLNWPDAALELNVLGDFLAGAFAPLAFLWLVLGFIQQGQELSLQIRELANSVTAQKDLVNATNALREQEKLHYEREKEESARSNRPILNLSHVLTARGDELNAERFYLENVGASCSSLTVKLEFGDLLARKSLFERGDDARFEFPVEKDFSGEISIRASFIDARSWTGMIEWLVLWENGELQRIVQVQPEPT